MYERGLNALNNGCLGKTNYKKNKSTQNIILEEGCYGIRNAGFKENKVNLSILFFYPDSIFFENNLQPIRTTRLLPLLV